MTTLSNTNGIFSIIDLLSKIKIFTLKNLGTQPKICFNSNRKYILVRQYEKEKIYLVNVSQKKTLKSLHNSEAICSLKFFDDEKYILTGSSEGTIKIIDIYKG